MKRQILAGMQLRGLNGSSYVDVVKVSPTTVVVRDDFTANINVREQKLQFTEIKLLTELKRPLLAFKLQVLVTTVVNGL